VRFFLPHADASHLPTQISEERAVKLAPGAAAAIVGAAVVLLCSPQGQPVIDVDHLSPDALATSISTNVVNAHEIDPSRLGDFDVDCDYRPTVMLVAGKMKLAIETGAWQVEDIKDDLPELLTQHAPRADWTRPVFSVPLVWGRKISPLRLLFWMR